MKPLLPALILIAVLLAACAPAAPAVSPTQPAQVPQPTGEVITGSGTIITEERPGAGFNGLTLSVPARMTLTQGDSEAITLTGDDNIVPLITTEVVDGMLTIGLPLNTVISPSQPVTVAVTVVDLTVLQVFGSAEITGTDLTVNDVSVLLDGNHIITLTGTVNGEQIVEVAGTGLYDGSGLVSTTATVTALGSAEVRVHATESLNAILLGTGNIVYYGNPPEVTRNVTGSGEVRPGT